MTRQEKVENLFKAYYHASEIESLLFGMDITTLNLTTEFMASLEGQKRRSESIVNGFSEVFGAKTPEIEDKFEQMNKILNEHMKITVIT